MVEDKCNKIQKDAFDEKTRALNKAMKLCSGQEKCVADILKKLQDWVVAAEYHEYVINELIKEKFIDEKRYASAFVNDKFRFSKWGKIKIAYTLKKKKISISVINSALGEIDEQNYSQLIEKEITQKYKTLKITDTYAAKGKLFRFAQSKGFEADAAFRVIDRLLKTD